MTMERKECPFCKTEAKVDRVEMADEVYYYSDCLCGKYIIDQIVLEDRLYTGILRNDEDKILFSGYLRNNESTAITEKFINEELAGILDYCQRRTLSEKISDIKNYIYQNTTSIGEAVPIEVGKLYTLFYLKSTQELRSIIKYLKDADILFANTNLGGITAHVLLTVNGFSEIESALESYIESNKVFIACEFDTAYQEELVKTIKAACTSCGFEANLVSDERHNEDISHKIISDIKQSKFVIADFTDENNGVYFEAGYAMGMPKEVIRLINKEQYEKLHFDTRQFNHISWEDGKWEELEKELVNQIKATIK